MFVRMSKLKAAEAVAKSAIQSGQQAAANFDDMVTIKDDAINERDRTIGCLTAQLDLANARTAEAQGRLARILAMETPNCANIGRKMARAARGEG